MDMISRASLSVQGRRVLTPEWVEKTLQSRGRFARDRPEDRPALIGADMLVHLYGELFSAPLADTIVA